MKRNNFRGLTKVKKRMFSKRGSVLFIVLVIMSFMIVLASAVYFAVQNGRKSIVMDYSDSQAFQTANDVLNAMDKYILVYDPRAAGATVDEDGGVALNAAISKLRTNCGLRYVPKIGSPGSEDCEVKSPCLEVPLPFDSTYSSGAKCGVVCGASVWRSHPDKTLKQLIDDGDLIEGEHYLTGEATTNTLGGGGDDISVIIFVNRHGDIVMEVTVEYNGRIVTTSRFYDVGEQRAFAPKWLSPDFKAGAGLHWEWVSSKNPDPNWGSNTRVNSGSFLYGKCWVEDSKDGWARRQAAGTMCRSKSTCRDPGAAICPDASIGGCFWDKNKEKSPAVSPPNGEKFARTYPKAEFTYNADGTVKDSLWQDAIDNGMIPNIPYEPSLRGELVGGCHDVAWPACPIGKGWWVWVDKDNAPATTDTDWGFLPEAMDKRKQWIGIEKPSDKNVDIDYKFSWSTDCDGPKFGGSCIAPTTNKWRIGRIDGWSPELDREDDIKKVKVRTCETCGNLFDKVHPDQAHNAPGVEVDVDGCICCHKCWKLPAECICKDDDHDKCDRCGNYPCNCYERNPDGTFTFTPPGIYDEDGEPFSWFQRAAFHSTGAGKIGDTLDNVAIRGVNATTHFDTTWAVLDKTSSNGSYRSDISANHNLCIGDTTIENPTVFNKTLGITVGKNLYIGNGGNSGVSVQGDNGVVGGDGGHLFFRVRGDFYGHAQNNKNYAVGKSTYCILGNVYSKNANFNNNVLSGLTMYVKGKVFNSNNVEITLPYGNVKKMIEDCKINTDHLCIGADCKVNSTLHTCGVCERCVDLTITWYLGDVSTDLLWPVVAQSRTLDVVWNAPNSTVTSRGDWGAVSGNPLEKYGIAVNDEIKRRIFYIDHDTTVSNKDATGADQNSVNMVIIDTGLGDSENVVNVRLGTTGTFNWNLGTGQTTRVAVMVIGDGTAVLEIPDAVTYQTGAGLYVGPFNMAVLADTTNTNWIGSNNLDGNRLGIMSRASNLRGSDSVACVTNCSGGSAQMYNGSPFNNQRCQWSCWLNGLLQRNGSGKIRNDFDTTKEIRPRNHDSERPLNMNIYLVYNGTGENKIQLKAESFYAGSIYCPRMVFYHDDTSNNAVVHFGSIFASELRMRTQCFFIAVLPGGDAEPSLPPRPLPREEDDYEVPDPSGNPGVSTNGSGTGNGAFDDLDGVNSGEGQSRH
ncbi:MAG: hypothetical protein FWF94_00580 [Oscillospiraceae bacterium]|nr:hypothetical protein [Oscillospiraceae bacterium]